MPSSISLSSSRCLFAPTQNNNDRQFHIFHSTQKWNDKLNLKTKKMLAYLEILCYFWKISENKFKSYSRNRTLSNSLTFAWLCSLIWAQLILCVDQNWSKICTLKMPSMPPTLTPKDSCWPAFGCYTPPKLVETLFSAIFNLFW